jgi:hypothetical protein
MGLRTVTGPQVGQVTWRARVGFNNGSDLWAEEIATDERDRRETAVAYVEDQLGRLTNPPGHTSHYHAHIRRGTYIQHDRRSPIVWEPDDLEADPDAEAYAWLGDDHTVGWGP